MNKRRVKRRPRQWSLDRLYRECRAAPVVWLALCDLASERGSDHLTPTRELLSTMTGIRRLPTISAALTALSKARWAGIEHIPSIENGKQVGTVLIIKLCRRANENRYTGRKPINRLPTRHRANENRSIIAHEIRSKTSLKGRGRTAPPLSPTGGASGTPTQGAVQQGEKTDCDDGPTRPITEILGLKNG